MPYKKCKYCGDEFWSVGQNDNVCSERCIKDHIGEEKTSDDSEVDGHGKP